MNSPDYTLSPLQSEQTDFPANTLLKLFPLNNGQNRKGLHFIIERTGDPGIFDELRIGVFHGDDSPCACVADFVVGLDEEGECRLLSTAASDGWGDHQISVFPERDLDRSVVID